MTDISALESRITAALDRIRLGLDGMNAGGGQDIALREALEGERAANAQLEERVRALKERQDTQVATLEERVEKQRIQMAQVDAEMQRLRASNAQMREINTQLREAASAGIGPELIDTAMAAEVEALQAQRAAEASEVDAILAELKPMIEEA